MQDKPPLISQTPISSETIFISTQSNHLQHVSQHNRRSSSTKEPYGSSGNSRCFLLSLPGESLTHITTYIDHPPSLFALSRVNRRLRDHIADDNTWYRAFAFHFLGVGPELDPEDEQRLMLRRAESTWKKEFVRRFNIARRWEKSRSSTLSYQPHYWSVSGMHLLENMSLMTSNLQYGIVTRSFPLTGKILKGHLDASGTTNGLGIGNPNEEFSPNVSCVALSSCGGTGRIAWGFRNGDVATTSAPRVMDSNRSAARYIRCGIDDGHTGDVRCILFTGREDELIATGCSHGQVKLWDSRRMRCLWTGTGMAGDVVLPDPCVKLEYSARAGVLVAALQGGDVMVWWGFQLQDDGTGGQVLLGTVHELRVAQRVLSASASTDVTDVLAVDPDISPSKVKILVHHMNERHFLRLLIDLPTGVVTSTRFCDGPVGYLTSIKPCFVVQNQGSAGSTPALLTPPAMSASLLSIGCATDLLVTREFNFILGGDSLGRMCVWDWDAEGLFTTSKASEHAIAADGVALAQVSSSRRWEAHHDGAVCAIEINNAVIVTGSSRGTLKVWDTLTLAPLRSFASLASKPALTGQWDPVGQIIVRDDLLIASVGSRILVWKGGPVVPDKKGKFKHTGKPKGRGTGNTLNKWQQQIELNKDLRESQLLLDDERAHAQRIYGRERAQLSALDQMGLNEREAVEYLLMLSRDEEDRRASKSADLRPLSERTAEDSTAIANDDIEGVFAFDENSPSGQQRLAPGHDAPSLISSLGTPTSLRDSPHLFPRVHLSTSNSKVQVSPPFLPEPTEAGFSASPLHLPATRSGSISPVPMSISQNSAASISTTSISSYDDSEPFPLMSLSSGTPSRSTSSLHLTGSWTRGSPSSSIHGIGERGTNTPSPTSVSQSSSLLTESPRSTDNLSRSGEDEEDEELRFVLELSLAEAKSCGER